MRNIVIVGAGDLGKELVWLIEDINKTKPTYLILGFLDDNVKKAGTEYYGYRVLGGTEKLKELYTKMSIHAVIAIQDGSVRKKIVEAHPEFTKWETIAHPSAVIASTSKVGKGCIFFPQVTVSVDSELGDFGLYYIQSTICNDCNIGNYVSVMSGVSISEHAIVGDGCFLAAGSTVYPHKSLGKCVKVSGGAIAHKDYPDNAEVNIASGKFSLIK